MLIENSGLACRQARFRLFREVKCCVIVYYYWKGVAFLFFLFSLGRKIGFLGSRDFGYIKGGVGVFFFKLSLSLSPMCLSLSLPPMCYVFSFDVLCLFLQCAMSLPSMCYVSPSDAPLSLSPMCPSVSLSDLPSDSWPDTAFFSLSFPLSLVSPNVTFSNFLIVSRPDTALFSLFSHPSLPKLLYSLLVLYYFL